MEKSKHVSDEMCFSQEISSTQGTKFLNNFDQSWRLQNIVLIIRIRETLRKGILPQKELIFMESRKKEIGFQEEATDEIQSKYV